MDMAKSFGASSMTALTILFCAHLGAEEKKTPESFYLLSGELKIRFDAKKFYTMNRIEYKGKLLGVDNPGSHYGTVLNFPGIGFIGSGHVENEKEQLNSLDVYADGKKVILEDLQNDAEIKAADFKLVRNSKIKAVNLANTITIKNNIIDEQIVLTASEDTKFALLYNFMHPWTTEMDEFIAESPDAARETGNFDGDGKFKYNKEMKWVAVYSRNLKACAVSRLVENDCPSKSIVMLWDKPPSYRKFYLRSFAGETLKKDTPVHLHLRTSFLECQPADWQKAAENFACATLAPNI